MLIPNGPDDLISLDPSKPMIPKIKTNDWEAKRLRKELDWIKE